VECRAAVRDANVLSIWEGTTNVMAEDVVRVLTGREGRAVMGAVEGWVGAVVREWCGEWRARRETVERVWEGVREMVREKGAEELKVGGGSWRGSWGGLLWLS